MSQAGRGPGYIQRIINSTSSPSGRARATGSNAPLVKLDTRARFNPNMEQGWFVAINQIINNISVLAIFLTGAAVLREREHGNLEHLLVMPLHPYELMFAKIWANGLVVVIAAMASLFLVVKGALGVPVTGSMPLFAAGPGHLSFLGYGAGHHAGDPGALHAAIRPAGLPGLHRHEPAVRRPDAARKHAARPPETHAVRALDPLRQLFPRRSCSATRPLPWSGRSSPRCSSSEAPTRFSPFPGSGKCCKPFNRK